MNVEKALKKITVGGHELDHRNIFRAIIDAGVNCRQALPPETSPVPVQSSVGSNSLSPSPPRSRSVSESASSDEEEVYQIKNYRDYTLYPRAQWDC